MTRRKAWLGIAVIFLSGIIIGAGATALVVKREFLDRPGPPAIVREIMFWRLCRSLDLDQDQECVARRILQGLENDARRIHGKVKPELDLALDAAARELKKHLSQDQVRRLDELVVRIKKKMPPPPPP
ncbi:MAG: hypothetical protein JW718_03785, partial [Desulfovibrionaceae bacterium]|nr:hypothetical protein [Desulfovibrionaceae bacterium]